MPEHSNVSQLVSDLLEQWESDISRNGHDPLPFLTSLAEIVEQEAILFWKHNPDPFDDRHPSKVKPDCQYGSILKKIFKNDSFLERMTDYCTIRGDPGSTQTMAVRLLLSLLPGVETSVFFRDNEEVVEKLYEWAEKQPQDSDLRLYSLAILGSAMQAELSVNFKEHNQRIASAVIEDLWKIVNARKEATANDLIGSKRPAPFSHVDEPSLKQRRLENGSINALSPPRNPIEDNSSMLSDIALIIGDNSLYPITSNVRQRLYLQFLAPVAQYQDLLPVMTKFNVLHLVDAYLDMRQVGDARLTFEALCLLASLLCHRKLASEFIQQHNSVSRLLSSVPRTTLPAAGVALCLYYLSYFEHTANRLCSSLSRPVLLQLMDYALGLVQAGYVSSRNHAALFLAAMLPYNQILEVFDACNGISYLYNSLSTLAIFHTNPDETDRNQSGMPSLLDDSDMSRNFADIINGARQRQQQAQPAAGNNAENEVRVGMEAWEPVVVNLDDDMSGADDDDDDDTDTDDEFGAEDDEDDDREEKEADEVIAAAQAARYPALAMKAYFDTHLHLRATSLSVKPLQNGQLPLVTTTPSTSFAPAIGTVSPTASSMGPQTLPAPSVHSSVAVVQASPDQRHADLDLVLEAIQTQREGPVKGFKSNKVQWMPVQKFHSLNGPELLVRLAHMLIGQESYTGRTETMVAIFDSLAICSLERPVATSMIDPLTCPRCPDKTSGVIGALEATHSERAGDASVVKSALSFLTVLCVCANPEKTKSNSPQSMRPPPIVLSTPSTNFNRAASQSTPMSASLSKSSKWSRPPSPSYDANDGGDDRNRPSPTEQNPNNVFECIQMNDGIMRLRDLLFTKTPVTEADSIRMHACRVLLGLAQSDTIRQILSRLSLFDHGQLQALVKEPVLQDKLSEHTKFCKYASELAERVSGMRLPTEEEMREQIRRTEIVSKTSYRYDKRELVMLMYSFLKTNGLEDLMKQMLAEGTIQNIPGRNALLPSLSEMLDELPGKRTSLALKIPKYSRPSNLLLRQSLLGTPTSSKKNNPPPPGVPLPLQVRHATSHQPSFLKKTSELASQSELGSSKGFLENTEAMANTLDDVVAAYLRQQHSHCPVPMSICPTFSLLTPHKCPVPLTTATCAPTSLPRRVGMCHVVPSWGGPHGRRLNRQFVFSRFQPIRTIRHADGIQFTCCSFLPTVWNGLAIGTDTGDVLMFDSDSGNEISVFTCHPSPLTHIQFAPWFDSNQLFLTSSTYGHPLSALWSIKVPQSGIIERDSQPDQKGSLTDDNYVEFGHGPSTSNSSPLMIGTQESIAHLYDVATSTMLMTLFDQERSSGYTYNRAHLDPADKLVLSDGLLWDVKSKKSIHKFDKLNADISGTFHPSGLEVIINCEVWDLRTYRLLRTVPDLNQCSIVFSGTGDVLYGAVLRSDPDFFASANHPGASSKSPFGSMFRTYHADDYTPIASVDVKRTIFDLAVHPDDHTVALVDNDMNTSSNDGGGDSCSRLYAVGLAHPPDNADGLEEQEEHDEEDDDDDDDDEDSDDDDDEDDDSSMLGSESSPSEPSDNSSEESSGHHGRRRRVSIRIGSGSSRGGVADPELSTRSRGGLASPPPVLGSSAVVGSSDVGSPLFFGNTSSLPADTTAEGEDNDDSEDEEYEPDDSEEGDVGTEEEVSEEEEEDDDSDEDLDSDAITISEDDDDDSDGNERLICNLFRRIAIEHDIVNGAEDQLMSKRSKTSRQQTAEPDRRPITRSCLNAHHMKLDPLALIINHVPIVKLEDASL